jgi:hypothetical protein
MRGATSAYFYLPLRLYARISTSDCDRTSNLECARAKRIDDRNHPLLPGTALLACEPSRVGWKADPITRLAISREWMLRPASRLMTEARQTTSITWQESSQCVTEQYRSIRPSVTCFSSVLAFADARSNSSEIITTSH